MNWRPYIATLIFFIVASILAFPSIVPQAVRLLSVGALAVVAIVIACTTARLSVPQRFALVFFALTAVVGWILAIDSAVSLSHFSGVALGLITAALLTRFCDQEMFLAVAVVAFLMLGAVILVVGIGGTQVRPDSLGRAPKTAFIRIPLVNYFPQISLPFSGLEAGGYVNPNALAAAAVAIGPVAAAVCFSRKRIPFGRLYRACGMSVFALTGVALLIAQSRSGWIAAVITASIVVIGRARREPRRLVGAAVLVAIVGVIIWWWNANSDQSLWVGVEMSLDARSGLFGVALEHLRRSPWFGIGMNQFRFVDLSSLSPISDGPSGARAHAHNIFLQTALDVGIPGAVAYFAFVTTLLVAAWRVSARDCYPGRIAGAAGLSIVAVHAFGMADAIALGAKVGLLQWYAFGIVIAGSSLSRLRDMPPSTEDDPRRYRSLTQTSA